MLLSILRTSFPDSAALPAGAIFLRSFSALLPIAAVNLNPDFCDLGTTGFPMNLVDLLLSGLLSSPW